MNGADVELVDGEADGRRALAIAQAARTASVAVAHLQAPLREVSAFLADLAAGRTAELSQDSVIALQRHAHDALDCVENTLLRIAALPSSPILVARDEIAAAAAGYVSDAPLSSDGLLVALSWTSAKAAFPALASALRHTDVVASWGVPARRLLAAVDDVDEDRAEALLAAVGLASEVRCADLGEHDALRLADALDGQSL